jgi:hypothetical protein
MSSNGETRHADILGRYEQELQQLEQRRNAVEHEILLKQSELEDLATERQSLLQVYVVTKNHSRLPLTDEERIHLPSDVKPATLVPEKLCKGKKIVEAVEAFLRWRDRPAMLSEIMNGMREGGFEQQYRSFENSLRSAMDRSGKFKKYKNAGNKYVFALPEWINRAPTGVSEKPNLSLVGEPEAKAKSA